MLYVASSNITVWIKLRVYHHTWIRKKMGLENEAVKYDNSIHILSLQFSRNVRYACWCQAKTGAIEIECMTYEELSFLYFLVRVLVYFT